MQKAIDFAIHAIFLSGEKINDRLRFCTVCEWENKHYKR
jgi:hypothetical protein